MKIDDFICLNGFSLKTGSIRDVQKKQFCEELVKLSSISKIVEIGFNAGYSAQCFFENCPSLAGFVSFDINVFPYTKPCAEFFQKRYPNRFLFVEGDSLIKVPEFAARFPRFLVDLIYIDGSHGFENVVGDITHCKLLSHRKTVLWLDDYQHNNVRQAIQFCETIGLIQIKRLFYSDVVQNVQKMWVEARYC